LASVEAISSIVQEIRSNARTLNHCATCSPSTDKILELAAQALRLADKVVSALAITQNKLSPNQSAALILRVPLSINSITSQSANSKEEDQRGRDIPPSKQDRSSRGRTFISQQNLSVRATSTKDNDEDELGLAYSSSIKSSHISNDNNYSDSDEGIESGGGSSNDGGNDDRRVENPKPPVRVWSVIDERRLRAYRTEVKEWSWIASKFGRTIGAVKQHWETMNPGGSQGRKRGRPRVGALSQVPSSAILRCK